MAVNYLQEGVSIDYTPGSAVAAGAVVVQGNLVGIAILDIEANRLGALTIEGAFDAPKETGAGTAIAAGAEVYWDAANSRVDDSPAVGKRLGVAIKAATDDDARVWFKLDPAGLGQEPASTTAYGTVKMAALVAALTDSSGGAAANGTIEAVTDVATAANAIKELATKVNELIAALKTSGAVASA